MPFAPDLMDKHMPGMGPNQQYVVGATNIGLTIVDTTLAINTQRTDAQLIASPPNTAVGAFAFGPVVHSLGVPPMAVWAEAIGQSTGPVSYQYVTADNSAVYMVATGNFTGVALGVRTRLFILR